MSYVKFKNIVEKEYDGDLDKLDREKVKKKLKIGDFQYAAWKGRLEAERAGKERAAKLARPPEPRMIETPPRRKTGARRG